MGKIIRNGIKYSGTYDDATSVNYDNSISGLTARTVQEGIDELSESLGVDIKLIDGVPNWSARGADSWSPFRGNFEYVDAISTAFSNTTKNNEIIVPSNVYKVIIICTSTSTRGVTTTISGDCIISQNTLSTYDRTIANYYAYYHDVYELEMNGQGGTITISRKSAGNCSFTDTIFY